MKKTQRALIFLQIGIFLLGISGSIYAAMTPANSMMHWYSTDDAFYYYQVARNAVEGHGLTFDGINLTNGYHPLWMLVCLAVFSLARFHLLLPLRVLIVVSGVLNGLTGVILFRMLRRHLHVYAAVLGALVWMLLPVIFNEYTSKGLESVLSAFMIALLLYKGVPLLEAGARPRLRDYIFLGIISGLTILSRLDNLFLVAMIDVFLVFQIKRIPKLVVYDMVAILTTSILAWVIRFGTSPTYQNNYSIYPLMLISMVFIPLVFFFTGFYTNYFEEKKVRLILRYGITSVISIAVVYGGLMLLRLVGFELLISRGLILLSVGFSLLISAVIRYFYRMNADTSVPSPWHLFVQWLRMDFLPIFRNGVLFSLPIAALVGGYMLFNLKVFGTASPVSGQVKNWWGTLSNTVYKKNDTLISLLGLTPGSGNSPWSLITTIIGDIAIFLRKLVKPNASSLPTILFLVLAFAFFILMVYLLSRKNGYLARKSFSLLIPALLAGCFLQIAYYTARGYGHSRSWYWVSESMVLVLLGAVISSRIFEKAREIVKKNWPGYLLLLVFTGFLLFLHTRYLLNYYPYAIPADKEVGYITQVRALEKETPEGSLIGMTGGGETAYFIENRTIINLDGLVNSVAYFEALKDGTAYKFLDAMEMDYVFGNPYMLLESSPYESIFKDRLSNGRFIPGIDSFMLYDYLSDR